MKDFIKFTFASLLGVVLAGIVFTILGIVTMVGMVASSDTETVVKENSIFKLDLKGTLSERVQDNPFQSLMGNNMQSYGLDDILSSIRKAKENENIKGIYLQAGMMDASFASLEEIRNALKNAPGVTLKDDPQNYVYPMPLESAGKDNVFVGRIRKDLADENSNTLWLTGDQIRKGAALNAVQIGEILAKGV